MANNQAAVLFGFFLCLCALGRLAPTIIAVANAVVPVLLVLVAVIVGLRLLWFFTQR